MSKRNGQEFTQLVQVLGVQPVDAARRILEEARLGRQVPRWLRRAARAITRRASAGSGRA
jgi:hypothetical protein